MPWLNSLLVALLSESVWQLVTFLSISVPPFSPHPTASEIHVMSHWSFHLKDICRTYYPLCVFIIFSCVFQLSSLDIIWVFKFPGKHVQSWVCLDKYVCNYLNGTVMCSLLTLTDMSLWYVYILDDSPLDLCDRVTNGDGLHPFPIQLPPGSLLCPPNPALPPGLGMRPPLGGLPPLLPGTNNLHLGQSSVTSSAAINAAAAR